MQLRLLSLSPENRLFRLLHSLKQPKQRFKRERRVSNKTSALILTESNSTTPSRHAEASAAVGDFQALISPLQKDKDVLFFQPTIYLVNDFDRVLGVCFCKINHAINEAEIGLRLRSRYDDNAEQKVIRELTDLVRQVSARMTLVIETPGKRCVFSNLVANMGFIHCETVAVSEGDDIWRWKLPSYVNCS